MHWTVVGGDRRQLYAAEALIRRGITVSVMGFENCQECSLPKFLPGDPTDFVLLPFPTERPEGTVFAPFAQTPIGMADLFADLVPQTVVVAGKLSLQAREQAKRCELKVLEYGEREEFLLKNAIPSAEGAIQIAMEQLPITLWRSRCLVIGCGRIGKLLAEKLHLLGAKVIVSARKAADFAWVEAHGWAACETQQLETHLATADVVFNTVPAPVLAGKQLQALRADSLVIDLASVPGGTDFAAAERLGRKALHALGLPGKLAPQTAGEIVVETVMTALFEQRMM